MSIFGKKQGGPRGTYLTIMQGFFQQKAEQGEEGSKSRINKKGDTVWEIPHETVNGHITNAYTKKGKYGMEMHITVENKQSEEKVFIQVPFSSNYARKLIMVANNINFAAPVELVPYHFPDKKKKDKFVTGWSLYQHGSKDQIEEAIDREDVPRFEKSQNEFGEEKTDSTKANAFLFREWSKVQDAKGFGERRSEDGDGDDDAPVQEKASRSQSRKQEARSNAKDAISDDTNYDDDDVAF